MTPLQYTAFVPLVLGLLIRRNERRMIARLREAGATLGERAIWLDGRAPLSRFSRGRLARAGVLQPAGNDRYYLNDAAYEAFRARRRTRAAVIVTLLSIGIAVLYFRGVFG